MAGIYVHIPFCRQACYYCNFHFSTLIDSREPVMASIRKEIEGASFGGLNGKNEGESIETVYFGGGTPSLLPVSDLATLMEAIGGNFPVMAGAEITLEANPDDITPENLVAWNHAGINRLSIGIQSFRDEDLRWMNRSHDAARAVQAIWMAERAGFSNLSVDLIYGIPGLGDEDWKRNIDQVIQSGVPHIACYALTVEPRTALAAMIASHKKENVENEIQAGQFTLLMEIMERAGYEHYEISNFAKPGWRSRHNSSYWQGKSYYGFGPSAHSYDGVSRKWNIANNALYVKAITEGTLAFEREELRPSDRLNEYVMTSLRTIEGLDLQYVETQFSSVEKDRIDKGSQKYLQAGLMERLGQRLLLTRKGKLFADGIASDLFRLVA